MRQRVIKDNQLVKTFKFTSFIEAFSWMTQVAIWSEKLNHHPHWYNTYHKVDVSLCTHDINGITELDFALAHKMEFCFV
ncbi:4a-hydroxytetrahydrobiopterin dehydratase [Paraglaciecola sp. 2405UD69-4]|uniref:4a-hydroxytetrahydrobiopterin dehydratase n=1 Tax=Paraglaciecola sp. 2405UD69-4 TaxID=3391836 RepID=UPI0039C8ECB5